MHQNRLGPDGGADSKWLRPGAAAACACVAALLIRAACAWLIGPAQPQEIRYITIAQGLLAGDGFVGLDARFPDIIQPPLYPLVLAGALVLPVNPLGVARGLSVVMGALLVFPAVILAGRLFGRRAAARAGWLVAVHPMLAHISSVAITESTFALLVAASILLVWRLAEAPVLPRGRDAFWYALAGVCLGFSNLTRPEGITYFLAAALVTAVLLGAVRLRVATAGTALLLIGFLVVVIPYVTWVHAKT
ncbi:MAG TPA: glycosyltransferase family 39 protein, partial [Candidatus Polarisedimenticolia bacterium]|nr:glycosyltransferase family 39 protein [Candidatus Polarisedimenticolia bacterium]